MDQKRRSVSAAAEPGIMRLRRAIDDEARSGQRRLQ
jgi:hypothetical protein